MMNIGPKGLIIVACCVMPAAAKANGYFEPQFSLRAFYDDNIDLDVDDPVDSSGAVAKAEFSIGSRTSTSDISISTSADHREYSENSDRNRTDYSVDITGSKRFERNHFSLRTQFDRDTTSTSELQTTGFVSEQKDRESFSLFPSWRHTFTEKLAMSVNASYVDVEYEDAELILLVDYNYTTFGLSFEYGIKPRTQLLIQSDYSLYEPGENLLIRNDEETQSIGLLVGATHLFTEKSLLTVKVGARNTEIGDVDESGQLYDFSFSHQFQLSRINLSAIRSLTPSGRGELLATDEIDFTWIYPQTKRLSWQVDLEYIRNERATSAQSTDGDRRYANLIPSVHYKLGREWRLVGGYRYRFQKYDNQDDKAEANMSYISLSYYPSIEK